MEDNTDRLVVKKLLDYFKIENDCDLAAWIIHRDEEHNDFTERVTNVLGGLCQVIRAVDGDRVI